MLVHDRHRADTRQVLTTLAFIVAAAGLVLIAGGLVLNAALAPDGPASAAAPATPPAVVSAPASAPPSGVEQTESAVATPPGQSVPGVPVEAEEPKTPLGVVVIDAGHQGKADGSLEPVGPGASEKKPKVSGGTRGVVTRTPESQVNLEVALKLEEELKTRGVRVIQVRDSEDVNISNSARAKIANDAGADLFIRLHCDGGGSSNQGLSTLIPKKNQWTGPIVSESSKAGHFVHDAVISASGAKDRGVVKRGDLSGFNWSKVPTILVEMGFMTNASEDRRLESDEYQTRLARGMADGVVSYLESER